jgi:serine/threonine-protein kinase RsbW
LNKNYDRIFKSNPELLPEIEEYVLDIVDTLNILETKRNNIELAVAEAAANCILHGNKNDDTKNVTVNISINSGLLRISFKDEGEGFIPENVPDPTIPENILKGSGRGVHIMKSLVDNLDYIFSNSGTELVLTFNL